MKKRKTMSELYTDSSVDFHEDDRRASLYDIFEDQLTGQINLSYARNTETVVAWHKHERQWDRWMCIKGAFKVGLARMIDIPDDGGPLKSPEYDTAKVYLSERNPRWITIPPGVWHGWRAIEPGSIMLYYLDLKYSTGDEVKLPPSSIPFEWETVSK